MDMSFLGGDPLGDEPFDSHGSVSPDGIAATGRHDAGAVFEHPDASSGPEDHLWMHSDGRIWDLGPADVDTDDDGVPDSLTRTGDGGLAVYTDSDRDGQVDKITEVDGEGAFSSRVLDPGSGTWVATDTGRLG
ncbi:hypothetical protein GIY30_11235 [Gordonia sp. HNM0687]|uniref:DUF6802 domain-containing protein n=1 Tax=Gordonia mangrovi TaxID=2665643 RepID=A0A6L7GQS6_9ACTN|nr:DUF6802 family protein [Gordonia mangrovi]MXP21923.1 hypothetical protein [Gordonia mangrovi]UVF76287.1 hypothetical protein NWF22_12845 [Gordonia mangrovi]